MDDAQAHIVQVGKIISSPGFTFKDPTAQDSPDVQEFTVTAYFTLNTFLILFSKAKTSGPPKKLLPL